MRTMVTARTYLTGEEPAAYINDSCILSSEEEGLPRRKTADRSILAKWDGMVDVFARAREHLIDSATCTLQLSEFWQRVSSGK